MSDSINRQNAIEGVKELFACADIGNDECDIIYMLENLPSTDRPTGEWIDIANDEYYRCSLCGCESGYAFYYCPNCGADMNETRADDDEYS